MDFLLGIDSAGDLRAELLLYVGGVNLHVAEDVVRHPLAQQNGQRVRLRPMRAPGVPDADVGLAAQRGQGLLDEQFQRLRVAKEKRERHEVPRRLLEREILMCGKEPPVRLLGRTVRRPSVDR